MYRKWFNSEKSPIMQYNYFTGKFVWGKFKDSNALPKKNIEEKNLFMSANTEENRNKVFSFIQHLRNIYSEYIIKPTMNKGKIPKSLEEMRENLVNFSKDNFPKDSHCFYDNFSQFQMFSEFFEDIRNPYLLL